MNRILSILFLIFLASVCQSSYASAYELDEGVIETLFEEAVEITAEEALMRYESDVALMMDQHLNRNKVMDQLDNDKQVGAVVLCWFVGGLGIHRVFLGGRGSLIAIYCITFGGCGVVWLVDFIILIVDGTERFENNNRFIAW